MSNTQFNLTLKVNDKEVKSSIGAVGRELGKLSGKAREAAGTDAWEAAIRKQEEARKQYREIKEAQEAYRKEVLKTIDVEEYHKGNLEDFGNSVDDMMSSLAAGDLIGFRAGMMGVVGGIKAATAAAWGFVTTPIGAALVGLAGIALATREWVKYNESAREANLVTQQITKLSGESLDQARIRAKVIEKTFGTDFKETITSASTLVEAFGISYDEAFDKIENGLIRGGKENDEFLESIREYPKLFAQADFSVGEFQRLLNTGIDLKIYSDKLPDAIKEFSLSVMEQTPAAREAMENAFGKKFTEELFGNLTNGSITVKDALKLIAAESDKLGLNVQQAQQLTADLFRGAGEDAGGALVIFEAVNRALNEEERALTALEEQLLRVKDANKELEQAQNDALKSDQYAAFASDLEVTWIKAKADFYQFINYLTDGLITADTAFRKFTFQTVQYVKDAFTIGADADWDALGKKFDEQQKKKEELASRLQKEKRGEQDPEFLAQQEAEKKRIAAEDKAAEENKKLKEERAKEYAAAEKKRLESLNALKDEYNKKEQDRLADTAVKDAELEMERALNKAKALGASQALIDQIRAEHQLKVDEEKKNEEEAELERMREFDARKREIENELRLSKAESDAEREQIQKEIDLEKEQLRYEEALEKHEKDLEFLELTETEKNEFKELLTQDHEQRLLDIQKKANEQKLAEEKKFKDELIKAEENLQNAKAKALSTGLDVLGSFFGSASGIYKALLALEKGYAIGEIVVNAAKGIATAKANLALVPAFIGTFPNPIYPLAAAATAKTILATKISAGAEIASIAATAIKGFDKGGFTDMFGLGYTDSSGKEPAGIVHKNEYVVPEFMRKEPEVPQILNYLETKRKKKLGLYASGGDVDESPTSPTATPAVFDSGSSRIESLLHDILIATASTREILFGPEAELKRQEQQKELDRIKNNSKIKKR